MQKSKQAVLIMGTVLLLSLPVQAVAKEAPETDYTQTEIMEVPVEETSIQDELAGLDPVERATVLIGRLTGDSYTSEDVSAAREAYDSLTMAQKLQIEDYEVLEKAEEEYPQTQQDSRTEDTQKQKNGTEYSFRISDYLQQVTLTIHYVVDKDGDGVMDLPDITLTSPDGDIYRIDQADTELTNEKCSVEILQTENYVQLNIAEAENGIWTADSSLRVVFELSDYAGTRADSFTPVGENNGEQNTTAEEGYGNIPVLILVFGLIVLILFLLLGKLPLRLDKSERAEEDDHSPKPLTAEEELAKIREEWEKTKKQYDDAEEDLPKNRKKEESSLAETIEDLDEEEDDGIEELDDGFFMNSRFH